MRKKFSFFQRVARMIHMKLVVPLKRSRHPSEHTARGVMVGVFWAFTPLVGIQMYLVFLNWLLFRYHQRLSFNLIIAMAWTWVTNVFTMWPTYYVYYITGRLLMGHTPRESGYASFVAKWKAVLADSDGFIQSIYSSVVLIASDQGVAMAIGCIPYAFGFAWLGYRLSLAYVNRRRSRRRRSEAADSSEAG